jgi:hypothetical protein
MGLAECGLRWFSLVGDGRHGRRLLLLLPAHVPNWNSAGSNPCLPQTPGAPARLSHLTLNINPIYGRHLTQSNLPSVVQKFSGSISTIETTHRKEKKKKTKRKYTRM